MNIIFDFDGVILNSHKIKTLAFYEIFKIYGKTVATKAKNYHLNNIGKSRYYKFKYILKNILNIKIDIASLSSLDKKFDKYVNNKIKKMSPSNYLLKFLKNKKKSTNLFISTGTPQEKMIKILKEKKLLKYFKKVYGSPKSKIYHIMDIKKKYDNLVFIGDSYEDFNAAKKTNINFILKLNSENFFLRKRFDIPKINSFKYLNKKFINI